MSTITSVTPSVIIDEESWTNLIDLPLADPTFGAPGQVDLFLGADGLMAFIIDTGFSRSTLRFNYLSWLGSIWTSQQLPSISYTSFTANCVNEQRLDTLLRKF